MKSIRSPKSEKMAQENSDFVDININDDTSSQPNNHRERNDDISSNRHNIISPVMKLTRRGSRIIQRGASKIQENIKKTTPKGSGNIVAHYAIHTAAMVLDRPKEGKLKNLEGWFSLELMVVEKIKEEEIKKHQKMKVGAVDIDINTATNNKTDENGCKEGNTDGIDKDENLDSYTMTSTGLYLDVKEGRTRRGADIIIWPKTNGTNQMWRYDEGGFLQSRLNGLLLDVNGGSQKANTKVKCTYNPTHFKHYIYTIPFFKRFKTNPLHYFLCLSLSPPPYVFVSIIYFGDDMIILYVCV